MIYTIYTDGATSNNGYENAVGGAAFVILNDKEEIIEQKSFTIENATNNICELIAIIEACKTIDRLLNTTDKAIVCSDSAYCINCYKQAWWRSWRNNGWKNSKKEPVKNKELWEKLIFYFQSPCYDFKKVSGHSSNKWNNYVDRLAVFAKGLGESNG